MNDALQLSVNMCQFDRPGRSVYPREVWANYHFLKHFYVTTGVDDFLNSGRPGTTRAARSFNVGTDVFFGGGVYFTDEDEDAHRRGASAAQPPPRRRSGRLPKRERPTRSVGGEACPCDASTAPRARAASPRGRPEDRPDRERPVGRLEVHLVTRRVPDAAELGNLPAVT